MIRKIATIDEFSPLWSDFESIYNNLPDEDKKQWLIDNCSIEPEEADEERLFDDISVDAGGWFIAWGDMNFVWVNLYERV
jgi:hypothetical protein